MLTAPTMLNGYPVIRSAIHPNCVTVMVDKPGEYVVATWWPELGTSWSWGHYFVPLKGNPQDEVKEFNAALADFNETANRNATR